MYWTGWPSKDSEKIGIRLILLAGQQSFDNLTANPAASESSKGF